METIKFAIAGIFIFVLAGCGSNSSSSGAYDTSSTEVISGAIAGAASSSDGGGSTVSLIGTCAATETVAGQACGGGGSNVMTMTLGGCTGLFGIWTGTDTLTYSSGAACTAANGGGLGAMTNGTSVALTSAGGITLTGVGGYSVKTDSNASGYASTLSGGTTVSCGVGGCATLRTVNITGMHRVLKSPGLITLFDHTLNTPVPLTISGVGAAKTITAGTIQLQHNLAMYTASASISSPLTFTAGCCVPTGGTVTTTFTAGTKSGTETVTYSSTCGVASVNGTAVTLAYCQ